MRAIIVIILFIYSICLFVSFSVIFDVLTNSKECIPQAQSSILLSRTGSRSQCRQESSYQKDILDLPLSASCLLYYFDLILEKRESVEETWHKIDFFENQSTHRELITQPISIGQKWLKQKRAVEPPLATTSLRRPRPLLQMTVCNFLLFLTSRERPLVTTVLISIPCQELGNLSL